MPLSCLPPPVGHVDQLLEDRLGAEGLDSAQLTRVVDPRRHGDPRLRPKFPDLAEDGLATAIGQEQVQDQVVGGGVQRLQSLSYRPGNDNIPSPSPEDDLPHLPAGAIVLYDQHSISTQW